MSNTPIHETELDAWYGFGLHREKAMRLIEEVRTLRAQVQALEDRENDIVFQMRDAQNCYALHMRTCGEPESIRRIVAAEAKLDAVRALIVESERRLDAVLTFCASWAAPDDFSYYPISAIENIAKGMPIPDHCKAWVRSDD
jgi:hypothetical protein